MKKFSFLAILITLFWAACNPNKELYQQLDAAREPYHESISYTLTDDDYGTIKSLALEQAQTAEDSAKANEIDTYKSFAKDRPAQDYVPLFLENTFLALDSGSAATIYYNYDYTFEFSSSENILTIDDTLSYNDDFSNFVDTIAASFPNAEEGDLALLQFKDTSEAIKKGWALFVYEQDDNGVLNWTWHSDAYVIRSADYESMGAPGQYHNFSSDNPPEQYLPTFLSLNFPYAQNGDSKEIVYRYYISGEGTKLYYTKYFLENGLWQSKEFKSDQFLHNGTQWVFDPTIRFTMTCSDYQIIVDWVKNNDTLSNYMHPQYDNTEYYFGASSYYCNFDMRVYKRRENDPNGYLTNMDDDQALEELFRRLQLALQILLETKYPDAQPLVNGVQLYIEVTFQTYEPGRYYYMMKFKCVDVGKFEYVEGSLTKLE